MNLSVVSVDPGDSTGIAAAEWEGGKTLPKLRHLLTVPEDKAASAVQAQAPDILIIERPPSQAGKYNHAFYSTMTTVRSLNVNVRVVVVSPGDWKPIAKARKWKAPGSTQHTKDACHMLRYFILKETGVDAEIKGGQP